MARFHINLSAPSQQMGFRIYAFFYSNNGGTIKAESRRWMGEEIIKGAEDGIDAVAAATLGHVQPAAGKCNRD